MKKHIILAFSIALVLGWACDLAQQFVIAKFHHHPAGVALTYAAALFLIGVPVLLWLNKLIENK